MPGTYAKALGPSQQSAPPTGNGNGAENADQATESSGPVDADYEVVDEK